MRARSLVEAVVLALAAWLSLASSDDEGSSSSTTPTPVFDTWVAPGATCGVNTDCPGFQLTDRCAAQAQCIGGYCVATPAVDCSATPGGGVCLAATCLPTTGECRLSAVADGAYCQPTDLCQAAGTCTAGVCKSTTQVCEDNNPCTANTCAPTLGCQFMPLTEGSPCTDGTACTAPDTCMFGYCNAGPALDCDDKNACTSDTCDPTVGCLHSAFPDGYFCDDNNPCTTASACAAGQCKLTFAADGSPCDDGSVCTLDSACASGICVAGTTVVCPTLPGLAPCYENSCNPIAGCALAMKAAGAPCDPSSLDPCGLTGACNVNGGCMVQTYRPEGAPCGDSNCVLRACQSGTCAVTQYKADGTPCLLNPSCFYDGTCSGGNGQCLFTGITTTPIDCDDADPCTVDTCDPQFGCLHTPTNDCVG